MPEMKDSGIEWIGQIPNDRNLIRNKYALSYVKGKIPSETNLEKKGVPYIGASDLDVLSGDANYSIYTSDTDMPMCNSEDILVLWDGARAGLIGKNHAGAISSTIVKITPNGFINKRFLFWYLKGFEKYLYECVNGTTIPHMNRKYIENVSMLDWSFDDQQHIADFLDNKCGKIDRYIEKQQQIIEELKAYKQSVITEAVTKGLDSNIPMKDSGIEWIGMIPEHWEIHKFCWDYSSMLGKMLDAKRAFGKNMHPYIKNINVQWNKINTDNLDEMDFAEFEIERYTVKPGDLMICEGGEIGKCAIIPKNFPQGVFYQKALHRVRKRTENGGNINFLSYLMFCMAKNECFNTSPEKATIAHLPGDALNQLRLPYPPCVEQAQIVSYLDRKCNKIDSAIDKKQSLIDKLNKYKKSIIYEAVTGKLEII